MEIGRIRGSVLLAMVAASACNAVLGLEQGALIEDATTSASTAGGACASRLAPSCDLVVPDPDNVIDNGSFESGDTGWQPGQFSYDFDSCACDGSRALSYTSEQIMVTGTSQGVLRDVAAGTCVYASAWATGPLARVVLANTDGTAGHELLSLEAEPGQWIGKEIYCTVEQLLSDADLELSLGTHDTCIDAVTLILDLPAECCSEVCPPMP